MKRRLLAPARVTLLLAVPHIDGDHATVRHEIWCAACCRSGTTLQLSRRSTGEWAVDRTVGGFNS